MFSDLEIARKAKMRPIQDIANRLKINAADLIPYGHYKAKIPLHYIDEHKARRTPLILVSAITPTPAGEGKTVTAIGLSEGLNRLGIKSTVVLREPSLGPVFGMKGGAAGGGYSQVVPMEDINLHFTGDFAAIEKANNLLAAMVDNAIQAKNPAVHIDPRTVKWKRVMDMNDRALRQIVVALGGGTNGFMREAGFDITAASEIMAILCFSRSLKEFKERCSRIFVGRSFDGEPTYAGQLKATGAMAILMKDALLPNLVQTLEGNPAIIHGGPFANIAQGTNTINGTLMGLSLSDCVVTEAGFGFDLGGEKFLDLKCRQFGLSPALVVLVTTLKALKYHGGQPLKKVTEPHAERLTKGLANLQKHLDNIRLFGLTPVVAVNHFPQDTLEEINLVKAYCFAQGISCASSDVFSQGGAGGEDLAREVWSVVQSSPPSFQPLYELSLPVQQKIERIATGFYGAKQVVYGPKAEQDLKLVDKLGLQTLPVCMAKTQYSFSDDPKAIGVSRDFTFTIRELDIASGAGFIVAIAGEMMRMPGLPNNPAAESMDIDDEGLITGLS